MLQRVQEGTPHPGVRSQQQFPALRCQPEYGGAAEQPSPHDHGQEHDLPRCRAPVADRPAVCPGGKIVRGEADGPDGTRSTRSELGSTDSPEEMQNHESLFPARQAFDRGVVGDARPRQMAAAEAFAADSRPVIVVILATISATATSAASTRPPSIARRTSIAWPRRDGGSRASTPPAASAREAGPR